MPGTPDPSLKTTDKLPGGVTGKGFTPGMSGNKGGRPKGLAAAVRERTKDGALLLDFMLDILEGKPQKIDMLIPVPGDEPTRITIEKTPDIRDRIEAVKWLSDRGWGKPLQEVDVKQPRPFVIEHRTWGPGRDPLAVQAEPAVDTEAVSVVSVVPIQAPTSKK